MTKIGRAAGWAALIRLVLIAITVPCLTPLGAQEAVRVPATKAGALTGLAYDSTASRPLAGARLGLIRVDDPSQLRTVGADTAGRFQFDSLPPGRYLVGADHARIDSLGLAQLTLLVEIRDGATTTATLSLPSIRRLIAYRCGIGGVADTSGVWVGTLRRAIPDRRAVSGTVRAHWSEMVATARGLTLTAPYRQAQTDSLGRFFVCSVPPGGLMSVRAWSGADSSGFVDVDVPKNGLLLRDVYVAPSVEDGDGALRGAVRGTVRRADGVPMDEVLLSVSSRNLEVTTTANGGFVLNALPPGTHTLEARSVGYAPLRTTVDIIGGEVLALSLEMEKFVTLDPVKVRVDRLTRMQGLEDFNERRKGGFGYFFDPAQLAQINAVRVTDLLRRIPGISILPGNGMRGIDRIRMRGGAAFGIYCEPQIFIDGARIQMEDSNIENLLFTNDIRAMEVYNRSTITPPQFTSMDGCGAIVFWTGPRR